MSDDIVERGRLLLGILHEGQRCRDFTLRPLTVRASMAARRSADYARCEGDDELTGLLHLAARLTVEGLPAERLTLETMLNLLDDDLAEILAAEGRLREQIARFRGQAAAQADPGPAADQDPVARGAPDAATRGAGVADGLPGAGDAGKQDPGGGGDPTAETIA